MHSSSSISSSSINIKLILVIVFVICHVFNDNCLTIMTLNVFDYFAVKLKLLYILTHHLGIVMYFVHFNHAQMPSNCS